MYIEIKETITTKINIITEVYINIFTINLFFLGPPEFELTPILSVGIFIGVLTVLICLAIAIVAALKLRTSQQTHQHNHHQQKEKQNPRPGTLQIKEKISLPLSQSEEMYDEKNPDVVPYNEGRKLILG